MLSIRLKPFTHRTVYEHHSSFQIPLLVREETCFAQVISNHGCLDVSKVSWLYLFIASQPAGKLASKHPLQGYGVSRGIRTNKLEKQGQTGTHIYFHLYFVLFHVNPVSSTYFASLILGWAVLIAPFFSKMVEYGNIFWSLYKTGQN